LQGVATITGKKIVCLVLAFFIAVTLTGCVSSDGFLKQYPILNKFDYKEGDLYSFRNDDGTYGVLKILRIDKSPDGEIFSVRTYNNKYYSVPKADSLGGLVLGYDKDGTGVGHIPIFKGGFEIDIVGFLKNEPVSEDELEGYYYWKVESEPGASAVNVPLSQLV